MKALLVIDVQNDYFPGGLFPLWNAEATLHHVERVIAAARAKGVPVVLIQHVVDSQEKLAPFFNKGSHGAEIHSLVRAAAPDAPIVVKAFADSFLETNLEETLSELGATELLICGMMTQNCVTHTAISKSAEKYRITVVTDCCTTVDEMIHSIALNALAPRVALAESSAAI